MKKWIGGITVFLLILGISIWYIVYSEKVDPKGKSKILPTLNLEKYDFDSLRQVYKVNKVESRKFEVLGDIKEVEERRKNLNSKVKILNKFTTKQIRFQSDGKLITGMMNYYPEKSSLSPVIIMIRGYAEKAGYYSGSGTWKVADELARQLPGFATISIDFLGYGDSEAESSDVLEARFDKVVQLMNLIETVKQLPWVDKNRIGIWAHSNGGQIALSVLEITGERYPTVLWAPMTNPFPQSLIDTADEGEEKEKAVAFVNSFLKYYDGRRYAFENYYNWIKSPVLIQQGTNDVWCRVEWQQKVIEGINKYNNLAQLVVYEGADHNLGGKNGEIWKEAVKKDESFYTKYLE